MAQDVVGSNMPDLASEALKPSKAGYGQNGYAGASSDMPGENTRSGFLPACDLTVADKQIGPNALDKVRDRNGKGNPKAPTDFKQPVFTASQTRTLGPPQPSAALSAENNAKRRAKESPVGPAFGMAERSPRNR
jgi:hypothetical protein